MLQPNLQKEKIKKECPVATGVVLSGQVFKLLSAYEGGLEKKGVLGYFLTNPMAGKLPTRGPVQSYAVWNREE